MGVGGKRLGRESCLSCLWVSQDICLVWNETMHLGFAFKISEPSLFCRLDQLSFSWSLDAGSICRW